MTSTIVKGSKVDAARQRLDQAVSRLERVLTDRAADAGGNPELAEELTAARVEADRLRGLNRDVSDRLDKTISDLEGLLAD